MHLRSNESLRVRVNVSEWVCVHSYVFECIRMCVNAFEYIQVRVNTF